MLYVFTVVFSVLHCGCPVFYIIRLYHRDYCFRVTSHANRKIDQKTDTRTLLLVSTVIASYFFFVYDLLVHGQVTITFIVSVCLSVCLFVCAVFLSRL